MDDDILNDNKETFDGVVSWLVILHIPLDKRNKLFQKIYDLLKPGGKVYIEDFFEKFPLSTEAKNMLSNDVYVPNGEVPTKDVYIKTLSDIGFTVDFYDATNEWKNFTTNRLNIFHENKNRHIEVYNQGTYEHLDHFYSSVESLFNKHNLGGVKLSLTK